MAPMQICGGVGGVCFSSLQQACSGTQMERNGASVTTDCARLDAPRRFRARPMALDRRLQGEFRSARRKLQYDCASGRLEPALLSAIRIFLGEPTDRAHPADISLDAIFPGAISRRSPVFGRALLPLIGLANVVVSAKAFGAASGVAMFILPCALIAAAFFRPSERMFAFALLALALAILLGIDSLALVPVHVYSQTEYAAFVRLNALSASALVALLGLILSGLVRD
jgi:hypothetical protein